MKIKKIFWLPIFIILILIILFSWYFNKKVVFNENPKTLKFKLKKKMFQKENFDTTFLFEKDDINYYNLNNYQIFNQVPQLNAQDELNEIIEPVPLNAQLPNIEPLVDIPNVDYQNVHESYVGKFARNVFGDPENINEDEIDEFLNEIKDDLKNSSNDTRKKIIKILNDIKKRNATITNLGNSTELSVLKKVWNAGDNDINIRNNMYIQLLDCIEHGSLVCPTGVVNRLVFSLSINDPEKFPKTKEMINNEILHTASVLREENEPIEPKELKELIIEKITKDYQNILTKEELIELVSGWIEYI
jgi:hypothetical protein